MHAARSREARSQLSLQAACCVSHTRLFTICLSACRMKLHILAVLAILACGHLCAHLRQEAAAHG